MTKNIEFMTCYHCNNPAEESAPSQEAVLACPVCSRRIQLLGQTSLCAACLEGHTNQSNSEKSARQRYQDHLSAQNELPGVSLPNSPENPTAS